MATKKSLQKKILIRTDREKNHFPEKLLKFFTEDKNFEKNQILDSVKIIEGIFVLFLKNFKLGQIFPEKIKNPKKLQDVEKFYRSLEMILEIYYLKKLKYYPRKKPNFSSGNLENFFILTNCFFFLSIGRPYFLNSYGEKSKIKNEIFWGGISFVLLFHQNKNIENYFDLKILLLKNLKKKELEVSQKFFILFLKNIKKVFDSSESEINNKRFLGFRLIKKVWGLKFTGGGTFLKLILPKKKNISKSKKKFFERKNHTSPLFKRMLRIMVQKTSEFLRDCSTLIKKEAPDLLIFLISNFAGCSSNQNYLYKKLTFKIDERKFFSKKNPVNSLLENKINKKFGEEKFSQVLFSQNFFFRKPDIINCVFLNRYKYPLDRNPLKKKFGKKKNSENFLSYIKEKKGIFQTKYIRSFLYNFLYSDVKKEEEITRFESLSDNFFMVSLEEILKNSVFFRKNEKMLLRTFRKLLIYRKSSKILPIINSWVSLMINSSFREIKNFNSVFLEILNEKRNKFHLLENIKKEIPEIFSEENKFQIKSLLFIAENISINFSVKRVNLGKKSLELVNKFLFTDKVFLLLYLGSFLKKEAISRNFQNKNFKLTKNHGLLLILSRGILFSPEKDFYYNILLRRKLILFIKKISLEPIQNFLNIIEKIEKKNQNSKRKNNNNVFLEILFFFQIINFKKEFKPKNEKAKKQTEGRFWVDGGGIKKKNFLEILLKEKENPKTTLKEAQTFITLLFTIWSQSNKEFKFIFLNFLQNFEKKNDKSLGEINFLIGFFFHVENEKGIRSYFAKKLIRLHLVPFTNHQKEELGFFKILTNDESWEILKKEAFLIFRFLKSGGGKVKKRLVDIEGFLKKKSFPVFILKQIFSNYFYQKKIQRKKSQYWDFIVHIFKKKELKEKELREILKRIGEIDLSFFWGKTWSSKAINWLKKLNSEFEQKKIILFLAWVTGISKDLKELEETRLIPFIYDKNHIFFQDKISLWFRRKFL